VAVRAIEALGRAKLKAIWSMGPMKRVSVSKKMKDSSFSRVDRASILLPCG
jgi:hypothetical protein